MSKILWEHSCFRQKNVLSGQNWTLSISCQVVISAIYPPNRSLEDYFEAAKCPFIVPQNGWE